MQRALDEHGIVAGNGDVRPLRQTGAQIGDSSLYALGNAERVRLGLTQNAEADAGDAV